MYIIYNSQLQFPSAERLKNPTLVFSAPNGYKPQHHPAELARTRGTGGVAWWTQRNLATSRTSMGVPGVGSNSKHGTSLKISCVEVLARDKQKEVFRLDMPKLSKLHINKYAYIYIYTTYYIYICVLCGSRYSSRHTDGSPAQKPGLQRVKVTDSLTYSRFSGPGHLPKLLAKIMVTQNESIQYPIGSMYAIYGNIYHQYTPNVSIYSIHGSYGY